MTLTRQYDAWGSLQAGGTTNGYAFTSREWDSETSLYYYRARYGDPKLGRFASEDPIGLFASINFYAYVENSPVTLTDPNGLDPFRPVWDFWTNYRDMRNANFQNSDEYFHCKANCDGSRRGFAAAFVSGHISEFREFTDQHGKGDPAWSTMTTVSNQRGQECPSELSCEQCCAVYRPPGLPSKY